MRWSESEGPDWLEYPCYKLDEAFQDFNPQVGAWAGRNGFDFAGMQREVGALYAHLHGGLTNGDLEDLAGPDRYGYLSDAKIEATGEIWGNR